LRHLLLLLDGTRDRSRLTDVGTESVIAGLNLAQNGQSVTRPAEVHAALGAILDQALTNVAKQALLLV
jgi:hypothetical protein